MSLQRSPHRMPRFSYRNPFKDYEKCVQLQQNTKIGPRIDPFLGDTNIRYLNNSEVLDPNEMISANETANSKTKTKNKNQNKKQKKMLLIEKGKNKNKKNKKNKGDEEEKTCEITTDLQKANQECCVYCSIFGFDKGDRKQKVFEKKRRRTFRT